MSRMPDHPGRRGRAVADDHFARILSDALGADVARSEPVRVDVAPAVMRRLGFRPCSVAEKRRMRVSRLLRRAAVMAVVAVAGVIGITIHNAASSAARSPAVTIPVGIERGLIRHGERVDSFLGAFRALIDERGQERRDTQESSAQPNMTESTAGGRSDPGGPGDEAIEQEGVKRGGEPPSTRRRAVAPGRWT